MKSTVSRIGVSLLLLALLFASGATPARAAAFTIIDNTVNVPVAFSQLVACAAGGAGELVDFSGTFHYIYSLTGSSGGPVHYQLTSLAQNVTGIGQVTGDSYVFSGGYFETGVLAMGEIGTTLYNYRIIGQGPGNNFVVHTITHYTFNANGELVADVAVTGATCM